MTIQWYPGHMTRARRMIEEELKLVDGIFELVDARAPLSSRNPELETLSSKQRLLVLTKKDLADPGQTRLWLDFYGRSGETALALDLREGEGLKALARWADKLFGALRRTPRFLVVGIPNVGKSTLINRLTRGKGAKVGAKPGVTRGKQWLSGPKMLLLDSPGVLWPKFEDQEVARKLATLASIKDEIFDQTAIAGWLLAFLGEHYPGAIPERYGELAEGPALEAIGRRRGCLLRGGLVDQEKAAALVLKDFRAGRLGAVTLDWRSGDA